MEEESLELALTQILPKILPSNVTFNIHGYEGKPDFLKKVPNRLKGYQAWLPPDGKLLF
ncbi:hypothetical protein QUB47_34735 [Microcoleus sp. AT9_B5]